MKFSIVIPARITTSMRKFGRFGDWYFLRTVARHLRLKNLRKWQRGDYGEEERRFAGAYFYDWEKNNQT